MTPKLLLPLAACLLAVAFPSSALAQGGTEGDNYLQPLLFNEGSLDSPRPVGEGDVRGFTIQDTNPYTVQADLFSPPSSGGPGEPIGCRAGASVTQYGKTVWSMFYAHRWGRADIKAAGSYDQVIGLVPFKSPSEPTPILDAGRCTDRIAGINEDFGNDPPVVFPGWWAVQFGGANDAGGVLQGTLEFLRPARLPGDAILSWQGGRGGAKIDLKATAPKGARISFKCVKKRCGKLPKARTVRKFVTDSLLRPVRADLMPTESPSRQLRQVAQDDPAIQAARSYIKNKKLKNGTRIEVRITAFGYIGNYFSWTVKNGSVGTKTKRCLEPESSRPKRRCGG